MQTPYQILQLKQKQRKKSIDLSRKQRSYSVQYNKNGMNATCLLLQKDRKVKTQGCSRIQSQKTHANPEKLDSQKYEIIFRESIRKVNNFRNKIYHNHSALKNQAFVKRFLTTRQNDRVSDTPNHSLDADTMQIIANNSPKLLDSQREKTLKSLKNKIILASNSQKKYLSGNLPEFFIQKYRTLQENHYNSIDKNTLQFFQKKQFNNNLSDGFFQVSPTNDKTKKSIQKRLKKSFFEPECSKTCFPFTSSSTPNQSHKTKINFFSTFSPQHQTLDSKQQQLKPEPNVANFVKGKRKRIVLVKRSNPAHTELMRATTDFQSVGVLKQARYYSPMRQGRKVRFNSVEETITGWEVNENYTQQLWGNKHGKE